MPFGSMYGALFFAVMAMWLVIDAPPTSPGGLASAHLFLAAATFAMAVGLMQRLRWARWGGAMLATAVAAWMIPLFQAAPGPAPVLFLVGSVTCVLLLLLPVTGRGEPARRAGAVGRAAAWVTALGTLGFVLGSIRLAPGPTEARATARPAARATTESSSLERVRWTDFGSGIERAEVEAKPLMVEFVASWCGYCKQMDRTTWKDPRVIQNLTDVVPVRVDVDETSSRNGYAGADLASRYGVRGTPSLMLIDADGKVVARADGYQDADQTLSWLAGALRRSGKPARGDRVLQTTTH